MFLRAFALAGAALALSACSHAPIPLATTFPYSTQPKVRATGHWDAMAAAIAERTLAMLEVAASRHVPVYVYPPAQATAFERGFHELLQTHLQQGGATVRSQPTAEALQVRYRTQLVRHGSTRPQLHGPSVALRADSDTWESLHLAGNTTRTELLLTTTVAHGNQYVARTTHSYYLEAEDVALFAPAAPLPSRYPAAPLKVVAP